MILPGLLLIPIAGQADSSIVWQIGKFDHSSHEFQQGAALRDPVFVVGKSDPARDWYSDQRGTSDGAAGAGAHPFTVKFELPQAPRGLYTLRLSLLAYSPRLPVLQITINGHPGWFYQHPVLDYNRGNLAGHFIPHYSRVSIEFDVPTRLLEQGTNTLVMTAVGEPGERPDSGGGSGVLASSHITYDALALEHDPAKTYSREPVTAEVLPTIFYQSKGNGLVELVDVFVRYNEPPQRGRVMLALGSKRLVQDLAVGTEFGEQKLRFEVPEFGSARMAQVTVLLNGRSRQFPVEVKPGKKWNVFVVPHEHLDVGYTDYPPKVAEVQSRALDEAIDMIREHPDFRYTLDAYWVAEQFMTGRSEEQRKEFLRLIREKKIFVPADYVAYYTGLPNVETVLRSFYHSYKFNRENGGEFDHGMITDIPSHSWSYPSLMASAGLKYLVLPSNQNLGPILLLGRLHEKSPFWWEGPDGQRVLTWYSRHYIQVESLFGLPPRLEAGHDSLPTFLQIYTRPEYTSDGVMVFGTQVENQDLYREQATLAGDWNKLYAYPKLKFSGVAEAMEYIARQMGDSIPVVRGDGGPYWDQAAASQPYTTLLARETNHRVLAAEKFSTISSLVNPRIWPDRQAMEQLWKGLLAAAGHSGTSGGRSGALRARHFNELLTIYNARLMEHVLARSMSALADSIQVPSGTLIVFNPLNWQRSGLVEFNLERNQELVEGGSNQAVPFQELSAGSARGQARQIRFMARDVPAVGYKCYTLRRTKTEAPAAAGGGRTLENAYYRVALDPSSGAVEGVFDKELGRELVDRSSPYRFNQYVQATGQQDRLSAGGVSTAIVPPPNLAIQVSQGGRLVSVTKTPFGAVARLEASAPNSARIATEITLFDGQKKIEIVNSVRKAPSPMGGWAYFAFPFAMDRPEFRYEIQNGVVNPAKDALPGAGREWFPVQHWAVVEQGDVTAAVVPVDAPLVTFGDIIRYRWPSEFGTRKATIFSYAFRGFREADPELRFRYVVTSGRKMAPGALSRLGWDAMAPFELNEITAYDKIGNPSRPLDPVQGSFLDVDYPGVVLLTWKRAEDEQGTIMRFVETDGQSGAVNVSTPILNVERGWLCNSVEENQRPLTVSQGGFSFAVKPFEIVTVRLEGRPRLK